jgi:tetratricopeptide (TPR) repeat protein
MPLMCARQYDEAIETMRKGLEMDPSFVPARLALALAYQGKGDMAKAIEYAEGLAALAPLPSAIYLKGWLYGISARREDALRMLEELKEQAKIRYIAPIHFAVIYAGMGDIDAWRKAMWASYEQRATSLTLFRVLPFFESLRSDPVYEEIVRNIGLP